MNTTPATPSIDDIDEYIRHLANQITVQEVDDYVAKHLNVANSYKVQV